MDVFNQVTERFVKSTDIKPFLEELKQLTDFFVAQSPKISEGNTEYNSACTQLLNLTHRLEKKIYS